MQAVKAEPVARARVLIVSTRDDLPQLITPLLGEENSITFVTERDVNAVPARCAMERPALIVFEREPAPQLLALCRSLKGANPPAPKRIMIVAAANRPEDRIAALEAGADDYVAKPFSARELALRIRALLRRAKKAPSDERLLRGAIVLDGNRYEVTIDGKPVHLTAVEFKLLRTLLAQPGRTQSRESLLQAARSQLELKETRTIDTHIRRLRTKLGSAAHMVETIRGAGYRLRPV